VVICEEDETLLALWQWLIRVTPKEVRTLPLIRAGQTVDDLHVIPEARSLIGFWLNRGTPAPRCTPSKWMRDGLRPDSFWGETIRERVASQVESIRHWRVVQGYQHSGVEGPATWFVDPPYQRQGRYYRRHAVDYGALAAWCGSRRGQVIVCENEGADWLPFTPFRTIKGAVGKHRSGKSVEVLWTKDTP
jgi:hypothetical protein